MSRLSTLGRETRPAASAGMDSGAHFDLKTLSVRFSLLRRRRRLVPASAIAAIDERTKVIGLGVDRDAIEAFL